MFYTKWEMLSKFYNNYKWSMLKNHESLYCIPVTYAILYINCILIFSKGIRAPRKKSRLVSEP